MTRRPSTSRPGFTLIEMIVVIIVIAIMASITMPRLTGNRNREFELVADQVSDLLMMYAQRESLGTKPVALWEDSSKRQLVLAILEQDEQDPTAQPIWVPDRFVRPVRLPDGVAIVDVQADGESIDITQSPLQTEPGKNRPVIAVILEGPNGVVTIALSSHALSPRKVYGENYLDYLGGPTDLDAAGRDREDW